MQRFADTIGLVIERERAANEVDHLRWYCREEACRARATVVHSKSFHCLDLGKELPPVIREYYGDDSQRTCATCGVVDQPLSK